jgi:hypothetical protein
MTGLEIAGVNLRIEDILTAEEIRERKTRRGELPEGEAEEGEEKPETTGEAE